MRFSDLLSKDVISLYDGSNEGIIIAGYFDSKIKKLIAVELASQNDVDFADEYILYTKSIYQIGQDAVTIRNSTALELKITADNLTAFSPINCHAYLTNGTALGRVSDLELDERYNISAFIIDSGAIEAEKIASHSKGTIIFYDDTFKTRVDKLRPAKAQIRIKSVSTQAGTNPPPMAHIMPTTATPTTPLCGNSESVQAGDLNSNANSVCGCECSYETDCYPKCGDENCVTDSGIAGNATNGTQGGSNATIGTSENAKDDTQKSKFPLNFLKAYFFPKNRQGELQSAEHLQRFETEPAQDDNIINPQQQSKQADNAIAVSETTDTKNLSVSANNGQSVEQPYTNAVTSNALQMQRPLTNSNIQRLTANSNLLIGKKITRTISTPNGELIGKKGNLVTNKTIYLATAHQKLRELVLYCQ